MDNSKVDWQQAYVTNKKIARGSFFAAILTVFVSGLAALYFEDTGLITLIQKYQAIIGGITFGMISFGCWFARDELKEKDTFLMSDKEFSIHVSVLNFLKGTTISTILLSVVFFMIDGLSWMHSQNSHGPIALVGCLVFMFMITILLNKSAKQIKLKYLTNQ